MIAFSTSRTTSRFNPYFAGSSSGSEAFSGNWEGLGGFNPYFAGSSSGSLCGGSLNFIILVSILILLEVVLEVQT